MYSFSQVKCRFETNIKNDIASQSIKDSFQLEQVKTGTIKSEYSGSVTLNVDQDTTNQAENKCNDIIKTKSVSYGEQIKSTKRKSDTSLEFEQVSPLSSPKGSEFSISSFETLEDVVEDVICSDDGYAYQSCQGPKKNDFYKKDFYSKKTEFLQNSVKRQYDTTFGGKKTESSKVSEKSIKLGKRRRSRDNSHAMYSLGQISTSYFSSNYRLDQSWERSTNQYSSIRFRRSKSLDKNRNCRDSRSPFRSLSRSLPRSPSRSSPRTLPRSPSRSPPRSPPRSPLRSPPRSLHRSPFYRSRRRRSRRRRRSQSGSSSYRSFEPPNRYLSIEKRKPYVTSPLRKVSKFVAGLNLSEDWINNHQKAKSASPKPPPLPNLPPPPKPPPPSENSVGIPQPPLTVFNFSNVNLPSHQWVDQGNQRLLNLQAFQYPAMPSVSVNNLPLVPGWGNLPVYITPRGEQILHDMNGRPIPIGLNGHLVPVDMYGRLYPHIVFPYNNQAVPIYMSEDGVLRLPNGEPVPCGFPNQLPVNIDGSIIPIGPDSRPLYPCPNIPKLNPFISPQVENPTQTQQLVQTNPYSLETEENENAIKEEEFKRSELSSAVIEIVTVSDLEVESTKTSPTVKEIEKEADSEKQSENNESEESAANKTESASEVQEPLAEGLSMSTVEAILKVKKTKMFEDVDLPKLVKKFSDRVDNVKIREIYKKKVLGNVKVNLPEAKEKGAISETDKSGSALGTGVNPEKEPDCTVDSEKYARISEKLATNSENDNELSAEEVLSEKRFIQAICEAISLFADIDFRPPAFGRFLFSKSSTDLVGQRPPNESPLLKAPVRLPFFSPESATSQPRVNAVSSSHFRFLPRKVGNLTDEARVSSISLSFAVQCDFTTRRIRSLYTKIEKLERELYQCKNENAKLTNLYEFAREQNKKKTNELSIIMKKIEEKNEIIRNLSALQK